MTIADTSGTRLAYIAETTEGTTPATPAFTNLRFTSESLIGEKQTVTSQEIRADGNIPDVSKVGKMAAGNIGFELTYGTLDPLLEGSLLGTWASDVLVNARVRHPKTFEKKYITGGSAVYRRYVGALVNQTTFDFQAKKTVTGQMTVMGRTYAADSAIITGATYAAANTNAVMNCASDFAGLTIGSLSLKVRRIQLQLANNLRAQDELGTDALAGIGLGQHVVTGTIEAYLEAKDILDALDNHTLASMSFTVGSVTANKYTFNIPALYLTSGDAATPGNNQDVMVNMNFQAIYDAGISGAIQVTRAVA